MPSSAAASVSAVRSREITISSQRYRRTCGSVQSACSASRSSAANGCSVSRAVVRIGTRIAFQPVMPRSFEARLWSHATLLRPHEPDFGHLHKPAVARFGGIGLPLELQRAAGRGGGGNIVFLRFGRGILLAHRVELPFAVSDDSRGARRRI